MRTIRTIAAMAALLSLGAGPIFVHAAEEDGVAIALVYDTSGRMN